LAVYCPFKSNPLFYNIVTTFVPSQANIANSEFQESSISPNPATNSINISGIQGEARIYNQLGQQLLVSQTNQEINISELPSGMYFVQVNNKTLSFVK
jgi:hypothetical protein